ncbi:hypothetical protein AB0H20_18225 [Nocardia fluminea]|jgi:hypothetical protein|uniref:Uncharacterized protein n=1 Tax=Nocardia fluminea TaxID=134984 RepID=A0A2N3VG27_9NOCA|nr:hypothetical protein [Nocardia fluminea]PKV80588.1 hypothetical protein ATK86_5020 [Nocardia fluminea]
MRRSTLILTTAGMILGGAAAIDVLDSAATAAPEPVVSYNVLHETASSHTDSTSLAVVRGLLATENAD